MAGGEFTSGSQPIPDINFNKGLNSTSGPLSLDNAESSDLQNIDFNKTGSFLKRNGYSVLNTTSNNSITGGVDSYTKLMLHADGANGGTTFTDSSASAHTVTAFNGAVTDTSWFEFGTASAAFNGAAGCRLRVNHSADWDFAGGDFTIDFWYRPGVSSSFCSLIGQLDGSLTDFAFNIYQEVTGIKFSYTTDGSTEIFPSYSGVPVISINTPTHIEIGRSGTTLYLFQDGVLKGTASIGTDVIFNSASTLTISTYGDGAANPVTGKLDEIRISKGICRHTTTFTPPTTAYSTAYTTSVGSDGLWWYEFVSSGLYNSKLLDVADGHLYKMDDLDGTWDDITGSLTITAGNFCDFENFLNEVYITNNQDVSFKWTGTGNAAAMTVPSTLTKAKTVVQYNNYLFLGNVVVGGTTHKSRFYWSNLKDTGTWSATAFIEISKDDGQQIMRMVVLGDRLVVFKERSIYNVTFTGDNDIPFIVAKANSPVGCAAPFSIQEVENGLVFLSYDGFYYYDGNNSFKISSNIQTTLSGYNTTRFNQARSMRQKNKNRYFCSLPSASQTTNDVIVVWDWLLNAFSIYTGIEAASMATVYLNAIEERIYFADYAGFAYRMDIGADDYPQNVRTAIDAYYYTNWKAYDDIVDQKGVPNVVIYFQSTNAILTLAYSYDFESTDTYTQSFSIAQGTSVYGTALYGTGTYAGAGGFQTRRDLDGRGRVIRFKFANDILGETFQIDGLGSYAHLETNV